MIKGLGHLIRTMFGAKRPAPALPSFMVGAVEGDPVAVPPASDDVLRRAMEAATDTAGQVESVSQRSAQLRDPREEELDTLPTLFLHGKAAGVVPETFLMDVPTLPPTLPDHAPARVGQVPRLETLMSFQEIIANTPWASADILMRVQAFDLAPHVDDLPVPVEPIVTEIAELFAASVDGVGALPTEAEEDVAVNEPVAEYEIAPVTTEVVGNDDNLVTIFDEPVDWTPTVPLPENPVAEMQSEIAASEPEPDVVAEQKVAAKKPTRKKSPAGRKDAPATKRRKSGKELPEDAVFLTDAVIWSQCGSWREFWLPPTDANSSQRVEQFRTLAASGKFTIWGLPGERPAGEGNSWTAITPAHWKKAGFDPLAFLAGRENAFSQAPASKSKAKNPSEPAKYRSLMVSKAEIEAIFGAQGEHAAAAVA
ncbi:MAG: hypothetical protein ABL973_20950 [Micropepsaceae bacterium]